LENGTMMKFAYPRVITQTPRKRATVAWLAWNSIMNIGVTGAMDKAGIMEKSTKNAWLMITTSFHLVLQFRGSSGLFEGVGTSTWCVNCDSAFFFN